DVFGNRNEKNVYTPATGWVTTGYAPEGWNPALPAPVGLENFNSWAVLNADGSLRSRNILGDKVDQLLARVDQTGATNPAGVYWILTDHLNSVRGILDSTGAIADAIKYDSYGNIDVSSELDPTYRGLYAWTGREIDVETNLQYNR